LGNVNKIKGVSHCVKLPKHVAERQAKAATSVLKQNGYKDVDISIEWYPSEKDEHLGPGSGILLYSSTSSSAIIGSDALGERGKPAEHVGIEAANKLLGEIKSEMPIDKHMADMIIPYMVIADGYSIIKTSEITMLNYSFNQRKVRRIYGAFILLVLAIGLFFAISIMNLML